MVVAAGTLVILIGVFDMFAPLIGGPLFGGFIALMGIVAILSVTYVLRLVGVWGRRGRAT
jgi:hypothetical protein